MIKELYVENAAVLHNSGCSCGNHDRTSLAVANQSDLLGLPSWDDAFPNPLAKEDPIVINKQPFVEDRGREIHGRDCLGLPEWDFSKPWPGQSR